MYSETEMAKLCDALVAYNSKMVKTKIKKMINTCKMHETVVGVAVTAVILMVYTNRVANKVYTKGQRVTESVSGKRERHGKE